MISTVPSFATSGRRWARQQSSAGTRIESPTQLVMSVQRKYRLSKEILQELVPFHERPAFTAVIITVYLVYQLLAVGKEQLTIDTSMAIVHRID